MDRNYTEFKALEQEYGTATPITEASAGKHTDFFDIFVFVACVNELAHIHGQELERDVF